MLSRVTMAEFDDASCGGETAIDRTRVSMDKTKMEIK
jgi:hypothetical protein